MERSCRSQPTSWVSGGACSHRKVRRAARAMSSAMLRRDRRDPQAMTSPCPSTGAGTVGSPNRWAISRSAFDTADFGSEERGECGPPRRGGALVWRFMEPSPPRVGLISSDSTSGNPRCAASSCVRARAGRRDSLDWGDRLAFLRPRLTPTHPKVFPRSEGLTPEAPVFDTLVAADTDQQHGHPMPERLMHKPPRLPLRGGQALTAAAPPPSTTDPVQRPGTRSPPDLGPDTGR